MLDSSNEVSADALPSGCGGDECGRTSCANRCTIEAAEEFSRDLFGRASRVNSTVVLLPVEIDQRPGVLLIYFEPAADRVRVIIRSLYERRAVSIAHRLLAVAIDAEDA